MERVMIEKGCDNCYYTYFDEKAYPCSLCIRGIERTDQWQPSKKTKTDYKKWDDFFREPTAEERKAVADYIDSISIPTGVNVFDLMDEPQTDCSWK